MGYVERAEVMIKRIVQKRVVDAKVDQTLLSFGWFGEEGQVESIFLLVCILDKGCELPPEEDCLPGMYSINSPSVIFGGMPRNY
jgi:hypothetical protein